MASVAPNTDLEHDAEKEMEKRRSLMKQYVGCSLLLVPAFIFGVAYGANIREWTYPFGTPLLPTLGLIPVGLGAIFALYRAAVLGRKPKQHEYRIMLPESSVDGPKSKKWVWQTLESLVNLAFALSILAVLIPTWIIAADSHYVETYGYGRYGRWLSDGPAWLAAYASMSMVASMLMHVWLAWKVKPAINWMTPRSMPERVCPHCSGRGDQPSPPSPKMSGGAA